MMDHKTQEAKRERDMLPAARPTNLRLFTDDSVVVWIGAKYQCTHAVKNTGTRLNLDNKILRQWLADQYIGWVSG